MGIELTHCDLPSPLSQSQTHRLVWIFEKKKYMTRQLEPILSMHLFMQDKIVIVIFLKMSKPFIKTCGCMQHRLELKFLFLAQLWLNFH